MVAYVSARAAPSATSCGYARVPGRVLAEGRGGTPGPEGGSLQCDRHACIVLARARGARCLRSLGEPRYHPSYEKWLGPVSVGSRLLTDPIGCV